MVSVEPVSAPRVCVVGSINTDFTFRTPRLPRGGETLEGTSFQLGYGGKGANQAVMAARLGAAVAMVARVGRDTFGDQSLANLRKEAIDVTHVRVDDTVSSGVAAVIVDAAGQNSIIVVPGANAALRPEHVQQAGTAIRSSQAVVCQLEVPIETVLESFRIAKAAGVRTILNPAPPASLPDELLRLTDICVPNETELAALTGQTAATKDDAIRAGRSVLERGPRIVVITLGAAGALIVDGDGIAHLPAASVVALDTAGAGDAFIGTLAVLISAGMPLPAAVHKANAVAALSVTRPGTQASFPTREEVRALLA